MKTLRRLDFEDELVVNDHVEYLLCYWLALVVNHRRDFAPDSMSFRCQDFGKCARVDVFPKSEAKLSVNLIEGSDDGARKRFLEKPTRTVRSHAELSALFSHFHHRIATSMALVR